MGKHMQWILAVVAVIGLTASMTIAADTETDGGTTYTKTGDTYTVKHVFQSSCQTADLLSICFDFKHLKEFYHGSEVKLVKSGPNWQQLEYNTDYKIYTSTSTYRKTLDREQNTVSFTMLSYESSGLGMPVMKASSGSYTIKDDGKNRTITYVQSVTLDREIGMLDWSLIKQKTKSFFTDLEGYVRKQEKAPEEPATSRETR